MAERANRSGHGPMGHGSGMPVEKAKDFKGTLGKMMTYMSSYRPALIVVMIFAVASTVFNVAGPKILSRATTELFNGLMGKVSGGSGIDFARIGSILLFLLGIYVCSAIFSFVQGWIMTHISQEMSFRMRREISEKINRMPMNYFESRTVGEVLSRITNDVDTMGQSFNQAITQLITSVATIVGVFIMMLTISPLMTLIALVILPISTVLMLIVMRFSQRHFKNHQKYLGDVNGQVEEIYSGHQVVKAFNREEQAIKYDAADHDICRKSRLRGGSDFRQLSRGKACDRGGGYSGVHSVCEKFYSADHAAGADFKYAAVHGGSGGARV